MEHHSGSKKKDTVSIEMNKSTMWMLGTFIFAGLFVASLLTGGFGLGGDEGTQPGAAAAPTPAPTAGNNNPPAPTPRAEVDLDGKPFKGDADAPVTIVEWSDFQCPFCSRFHSQTLTQLETEYIDTGKVKFYYLDFPLDSIHPQATPAALAAKCALEQGDEHFWDYHDILFENQRSLNEANYKTWAGELGLDQGDFDECYDSNKYGSDIRAELSAGQGAGIRGTPGFLVNGQLLSGAQPFSAFQQVIEAELAAN